MMLMPWVCCPVSACTLSLCMLLAVPDPTLLSAVNSSSERTTGSSRARARGGDCGYARSARTPLRYALVRVGDCARAGRGNAVVPPQHWARASFLSRPRRGCTVRPSRALCGRAHCSLRRRRCAIVCWAAAGWSRSDCARGSFLPTRAGRILKP